MEGGWGRLETCVERMVLISKWYRFGIAPRILIKCYREILTTSRFLFSCCDVVTITDANNSLSTPLELCGLQTALEPLHPAGELHVNFLSDDIHVPGSNGFRLSYYQERGKTCIWMISQASANRPAGYFIIHTTGAVFSRWYWSLLLWSTRE